ncbi:MAG TPA: ACP phosphodiesterase [Phycisphaerae bacterium]|nr:ACP phosphodiesterase [Phycisphaerae bacterium]
MNLLAHAFLSPADDAMLAGNVVADWVKGRARRALPAGMRAGLELHGRIDRFADAHAGMHRAAAALEGRWGRYSPVLADVFFDHVLAAGWGEHSQDPLPVFTRRVYDILLSVQALLPERATHAVCAMIADDWLTSYATLDGMRLALTRMSARLRHGIELAPAVDDFFHARRVFEGAFGSLFPALCRHVALPPWRMAS